MATKTYIPIDLEERVAQDLAIGSDLEEEFRKQPSLYAFYAFERARAEDQVRRCEEALELEFGRLYREYKAEEPTAKENDCKSYIRDQKSYRERQYRRRKALYRLDILKAAVRAFESRASMLQQLGPMKRQELEEAGMGAPDLKPRNIRDKSKAAAEMLRRKALSRKEKQ